MFFVFLFLSVFGRKSKTLGWGEKVSAPETVFNKDAVVSLVPRVAAPRQTRMVPGWLLWLCYCTQRTPIFFLKDAPLVSLGLIRMPDVLDHRSEI